MLNGMALALKFADEKGCIGLTASGAFNRTFVHWAAVHFQWPGYTADELFRENKSLNEADIPPLWPIRDLSCQLAFLVRKKSALFTTDQGLEFMKNPMSGFDRVASAYLLNMSKGRWPPMRWLAALGPAACYPAPCLNRLRSPTRNGKRLTGVEGRIL